MRIPPEVSAREVLDLLMRSAASAGQPASGTFELTSRCNLACGMCYISRPAGDSLARSRELNATEWLTLAREAADRGMVFMLITGGEPLLRHDFFQIYEPLTSLGLRISLYTNGTLIRLAQAARLAEKPPSRIEITLYGASSETYEWVTGVPGSYQRCLAGIDYLQQAGLSPVLKTTITRRNVEELSAMEDLARSRGLSFYAGWLVSRRRNEKECGIEHHRRSARECVALEALYKSAGDESTVAKEEQGEEIGEGDFYCQAGRNSFVIDPTGAMNVCVDLPLPGARVMERGFDHAWHQVRAFVESVPASVECAACSIKADCPRCPAWSYSETGNLTKRVPYLCEIAMERVASRAGRTAS